MIAAASGCGELAPFSMFPGSAGRSTTHLPKEERQAERLKLVCTNCHRVMPELLTHPSSYNRQPMTTIRPAHISAHSLHLFLHVDGALCLSWPRVALPSSPMRQHCHSMCY